MPVYCYGGYVSFWKDQAGDGSRNSRKAHPMARQRPPLSRIGRKFRLDAGRLASLSRPLGARRCRIRSIGLLGSERKSAGTVEVSATRIGSGGDSTSGATHLSNCWSPPETD